MVYMGITKVKLIIKNPFNGGDGMEEEFLVDTGAHYTVIPQELVKKLNLKSSFTQEFYLADGRIIKRDVGGALVRFQDKELPVPVVLGKKGDSALLGITTLESFGLMIDPFKRTIYHSKLMLGSFRLRI